MYISYYSILSVVKCDVNAQRIFMIIPEYFCASTAKGFDTNYNVQLFIDCECILIAAKTPKTITRFFSVSRKWTKRCHDLQWVIYFIFEELEQWNLYRRLWLIIPICLLLQKWINCANHNNLHFIFNAVKQ